MSFFGGSKKSDPAPRPVTQAIAKSTPTPVIQKAATAEVDREKKQVSRGAKRRATKLTGARGLQEEASTRGKTLLGV